MKTSSVLTVLFSFACTVSTAETLNSFATLPDVTVKKPRKTSLLDTLPAAIGAPGVLDISAISPAVTAFDQALVDNGLAAWDAGNSLGIFYPTSWQSGKEA